MDKMTYNKAVERLEVIMEQINSGKTDIDALSALISEARELIKFCRGKLYSVDDDVKKLLAEIADDTRPE